VYSLRQQCWKKKGVYASREEAEERLKWFVSKGIHKPGEMIPYECPNCKKWHLGHDPKLREKERNEFLSFMTAFKVKKQY